MKILNYIIVFCFTSFSLHAVPLLDLVEEGRYEKVAILIDQLTPDEINKTRTGGYDDNDTKPKYANKIDYGLNALELAIDNKDAKMVRLLLENGANPNQQRQKSTHEHGVLSRTPLSNAIEKGDPEIVTLLIEKSGTISDVVFSTDLYYWNVFHYIEETFRKSNKVEPLFRDIKKEIEMNGRVENELIKAVIQGINSTALITEAVVELFKKFSCGNLLWNAVNLGTDEEFNTLLQYGIPLQTMKVDYISIVKVYGKRILRKSKPAPFQSITDHTPSKIEHLPYDELVNFCYQNPREFPPLVYAIWLKQNAIALELMEELTVEQLNNQRTPIERVSYIDQLPYGGCQWHDNIGFNALEMAIQTENKEMVKLLLEKGANPNLEKIRATVCDRSWFKYTTHTPFSLAQEIGNEEIIDILLSF